MATGLVLWGEGAPRCEIDDDGAVLEFTSGEAVFRFRMGHVAARHGAVELLRKLNAWEDAQGGDVLPLKACG